MSDVNEQDSKDNKLWRACLAWLNPRVAAKAEAIYQRELVRLAKGSGQT